MQINIKQKNNPKQIKAVFFDIDGTLVSFNTHGIPESTEKALRELRQNGIRIIVATGRSVTHINHIKHLDFDGFITFNGGLCLTKDGGILHKETINPADIARLFDRSKTSFPFNFSLMEQDTIMVREITPDVLEMYASVNLPVPPLIDMNRLNMKSIMQANIFISPDKEPEFMKQVMPNSTASRWTPLFMDVNPKDISKKVGVDAFCRHFSIDVAETMSFGDGGNDITMLKHTGIGVAMGNASPDVKAVADYITDHTDDDGVWNALQHFGLI